MDIEAIRTCNNFPTSRHRTKRSRCRKHSYFALGDNSYFSKDSRDFGAVPELNVTGKGLFVYWPFSKRWGLIR